MTQNIDNFVCVKIVKNVFTIYAGSGEKVRSLTGSGNAPQLKSKTSIFIIHMASPIAGKELINNYIK